MSEDDAAHRPKPPKPVPTAREARLAQALRANLRRRKAPSAPPAESDGDGSSSWSSARRPFAVRHGRA